MPHDDGFARLFSEEKKFLLDLLPENKVYRISHIGSTAINFIAAKPIADILLETYSSACMEQICDILTENGYVCMSKTKGRISLNKGYTKNGYAEKVFHLHLRIKGDNDELYFRDYLNEKPEIAKSYEKLKLTLSEKYKYNRDAYTQSKTEFVSDITERAKKYFGNKYN